MFEGSRGDVLSHSTNRARGLAICAIAALAVLPWTADAQLPAGFVPPETVDSTTAAPLADPQIVTDGGTNWLMVYSSNMGAGDADIYYRTSVDGGTVWSAPRLIDPAMAADAVDDGLPSVATNNGSLWVVAWSDGTNIRVATHTNPSSVTNWTLLASPGAGTSSAIDVNGSNLWIVAAANAGNIDIDTSAANSSSIAGGSSPAIASDGTSNWVLAFVSAGNVMVMRSTDSGATAFANPTNPATGILGPGSGPFVGYDPQVGAFVVFWRTATGIGMAVSTDDGATWSTSVGDIVAGTPSPFTEPVAAATDGVGNWTLLFADSNLDILFATSGDNGASWSAAQFVADTTSQDGNPDIATSDGNRWIAIWDGVDGAAVLVLLATSTTTTTTAPGDDDDDDGPCFIASAAYGTPMAKDIEVLREMRDTYLMNNALGLFFVDAYYTISPAIADQVAQHPWAASLVRALLIPVLLVVDLFMRAPVPFMLMGIFMAAMIVRRGIALRRAS